MVLFCFNHIVFFTQQKSIDSCFYFTIIQLQILKAMQMTSAKGLRCFENTLFFFVVPKKIANRQQNENICKIQGKLIFCISNHIRSRCMERKTYYICSLDSTSLPQTGVQLNIFLATKSIVHSKYLPITMQFNFITAYHTLTVQWSTYICRPPNDNQYTLQLSMRLIATVISVSLWAKIPVVKQQHHQTEKKPESHLIRNSKSSLGSANQICLLLW